MSNQIAKSWGWTLSSKFSKSVAITQGENSAWAEDLKN